MQEQNASPINLMLLLALSYLLHKSNITQLGIFSIQLLIIEIYQSFPHSNNRIIQITPPSDRPKTLIFCCLSLF